MPFIQSIICFNGGSAGDFLKIISLQQLDPDFKPVIDANGMALPEQYFKHFVAKLAAKKTLPERLSVKRLRAVEQCHYYDACYHDWAQSVFYIDYPDSVNQDILEIFIQKRRKNSVANFLFHHKNSVPEALRHRVTESNAIEVGSIFWQKNLQLWRDTPALKKISLQDYFDPIKFQNIVQQVMGQPLRDHIQFDQTYQQWIDKNQRLADLFA